MAATGRESGAGAEVQSRRDLPRRRNPAVAGAPRERLIGFEPTTFCMASQ
jgi:hypothetical protein